MSSGSSIADASTCNPWFASGASVQARATGTLSEASLLTNRRFLRLRKSGLSTFAVHLQTGWIRSCMCLTVSTCYGS